MPQYPTTTQKTMPYDSPSGEINTWKWVPPFEPVKNGFGFMGVLAEDTGSGKIQCHICGKWFEVMTTHIYAAHKMNSKQYNEKFGLFRSTALKSMRIRKIQSEVMMKMRRSHPKHRIKFKKGNTECANRKGWQKPVEGRNRYGLCDLQVKDKIMKMKDRLGRTPALTELIDEYGGAFATLIHNRYDGYLALLKKMKMTPVTSSFTPKFSREYFINKGVNALKNGRDLIGKQILNRSEERNIYNYFSSQRNWKNAVRRKYYDGIINS
jgi:hypothetical protein